MRDGTAEGPEAQRCFEALRCLAERIGFEKSLLMALPSSLLKPLKDRGSFDAMVVAQLSEGLTKRLAGLKELLEKGEQEAEQGRKVVQEAVEALEAEKVKQQEAAEVFEAARKLLKEVEVGKKDATKKASMGL